MKGYLYHLVYNCKIAFAYLCKTFWHVRHGVLPVDMCCSVSREFDIDLKRIIIEQQHIVKSCSSPELKVRNIKILKWLKELEYVRTRYRS